jgi:alpha-L-fucosidase 2
MRDSQTEKLWYKVPAENWIEALPIGNGRLGAMVYGGPNRDLLSLNEDSIWDGKPMDKLNPKGLAALPKVRELIFQGHLKEAVQLGNESLVSKPRRVFPYQPLGDVIIENRQSHSYLNYRRELDLQTAIARTSYEMGDAHYTREYFVSAPDQVIAFRYSCDKPGRLNVNLGFYRRKNLKTNYINDNEGIFLEGWGDPEGIRFAALLKIEIEASEKYEISHLDGVLDRIIDYPTLNIYGADRITVYITAATTYRCKDPASEATLVMKKAQKKGWDKIRESHISDYIKLYDRFELRLSGDSSGQMLSTIDTIERLEAVRAGAEDPGFFTLYSNYCRYLIISASRPGCLPSNLQGIWNQKFYPPWESDFHTNINYQINYWPVEAYNLAECHQPVIDFLEKIVPFGEDTAKRLYGIRGWVLHHCTDIWCVSSPISGLIGVWPVGGIWCCRDLYEYYLHTMDLELIRTRGYKILKDAVEFMLDFLIEAPENTPWAGYLVTNPSHSPENHYYAEDGTRSDVTWAATMDIEIINDLFSICIEFIDIIGKTEPGFENEFRQKIADTLKRLPPIQISAKTGGIQEWIYDYDEVNPGHRHVSHLYALYPGFQITPEKESALAEAAKNTIYRRYTNGYDSQGWSMGWIANIWARLRNRNEAYKSLRDVAEKHLLYNLFINAHGSPQVGDMMAEGAAILECLAQSHDGTIRLLPALPEAWANGTVRGMKIRGGHELSMVWQNGKLMDARIDSIPGAVKMPVDFPEKENYLITDKDGIIFIRHL